MQPSVVRLGVVLFSLGLALASALAPQAAAADPAASVDDSSPISVAGGVHERAVCALPALPDSVRCHAHVRLDAQGQLLTSSTPLGLAPADLLSAYALPVGSSSPTVALVDAFDDPNAESDLGVYRSQWGFPPCTTSNGCFTKVNQTGGSALPTPSAGWAQEISLDLDMVSAICPTCHILLVEATNGSINNLGHAVDYAASVPGVVAISNSYGVPESIFEVLQQSHWNHPGIAITVSSGDSGYKVDFPAASRYVTAVGGTTLVRATGTARGWTESAWSGAGSGCSAFISKPSWQTDAGCSRRTVADVAAVANPATGVAVYDTYGALTGRGWMVFGATSVASPIIASVYALAGNTRTLTAAASTYTHPTALFDVTSGRAGTCGTYLCQAMPGYDGPTGNGTPNGTAAF